MLQGVKLLRQLRIVPHGKISRYCSTGLPKSLNTLGFQHNFSQSETEKILNTINRQTEAELCNFQISKQRIKKIEARKQKFGEFTSIEDILELDGFGVTVLEKFCASILAKTDGGKDEETKTSAEEDEPNPKSMRQQFVSPKLSEIQRTSITSCVSFHIDLNAVAWTKLSLNFDESVNEYLRVEEWMRYEIGNEDKKLSLSDLIQISLHLDRKIPEADVYIIEAAQTQQKAKQLGNPIQMNINVQKSQLLAILGTLMASRANQSAIEGDTTDQIQVYDEAEMSSNLFFLKNFLASKLYKTLVGYERVSSEQVIEKLLRFNLSTDVKKKSSFETLDAPQHLREYYRTSPRVDREFLGQSMLIGLTFMNLCVIKCPKSVAMLNKKR